VAQPLAVIVDAHDRLSGALSGKPIA
jgi:hypothetical protein